MQLIACGDTVFLGGTASAQGPLVVCSAGGGALHFSAGTSDGSAAGAVVTTVALLPGETPSLIVAEGANNSVAIFGLDAMPTALAHVASSAVIASAGSPDGTKMCVLGWIGVCGGEANVERRRGSARGVCGRGSVGRFPPTLPTPPPAFNTPIERGGGGGGGALRRRSVSSV